MELISTRLSRKDIGLSGGTIWIVGCLHAQQSMTLSPFVKDWNIWVILCYFCGMPLVI
jgi:hypothetical protein